MVVGDLDKVARRVADFDALEIGHVVPEHGFAGLDAIVPDAINSHARGQAQFVAVKGGLTVWTHDREEVVHLGGGHPVGAERGGVGVGHPVHVLKEPLAIGGGDEPRLLDGDGVTAQGVGQAEPDGLVFQVDRARHCDLAGAADPYGL